MHSCAIIQDKKRLTIAHLRLFYQLHTSTDDLSARRLEERVHCTLICKAVKWPALHICVYARTDRKLLSFRLRPGVFISAHAQKFSKSLNYCSSTFARLSTMALKLLHLRFCPNVYENYKQSLVRMSAAVSRSQVFCNCPRTFPVYSDLVLNWG